MERQLGRYRLIAELARGGMGIVHLAQARGPGGFEKLVVVKELKPELSDDPVYTTMFLDEARLAARLTHRHIVETNEVGCDSGRYFMALELLEGGSLHQIRSKLGLRALPVNLALRVLAATLDALDHAHELTDDSGQPLSVVHRDVSAHNVFLTFDGDVKLIDFGVAKSADRGERAATRVGIVKGSVPYMAPDHVDGCTIDRRADVFAVGVLLREMLCGERLWGDLDDMAIVRRLLARDIPALPAHAASADAVPARLRAIMGRAMAADRAERYPTAAAMRDALEAYLLETDPRGSLADLRPWLATSLAKERDAFREIVKRGRIGKATAGAAHVWLPSSELMTRFSGPPALPTLPPSASASASSSATTRPVADVVADKPRTHAPGRALRYFGAGAVFAAALVVAALGLPAKGGALAGASDLEDRAARVVEDPVAVNASPTLGEVPDPPEPDAFLASSAVAEAASQVVDAPASRVPASVLREALPPNPYE